MKKFYLYIAVLCILHVSTYCMEKEALPVQFMYYWAEYCYRQGTDFDDDRRDGYDDRFPCWGRSCESHFFDHDKVKEIYPDALGEIKSLCIGNARALEAAFRYKKPSEVIDTFNPEQKKMLLQQCKDYKPSLFKLIGNTCISLTGLAGIITSAYVGYSSEDIKIKLGSLAAGIFSSLVTLYGAKNTRRTYHDRSWWQQCPNFQNIMKICKTT